MSNPAKDSTYKVGFTCAPAKKMDPRTAKVKEPEVVSNHCQVGQGSYRPIKGRHGVLNSRVIQS